jgi:Host cell surface-exposed lipoprotein/PASTA domain
MKKALKWIVIGIVGLGVIGALIPSEEKEAAAPAKAQAAEKAPKQVEPKPETKIKVPDVIGMNHQEAQDALQAAGLYSLNEQDCTPRPGRKVSEDRTITLCSEKIHEDQAAAPAAPPEPAEPAEPAMSSAQENAVATAQDYLDYDGFSRQGLIEQLTFEDFSEADATYAVDHVDVDWNAEAVETAQSYLDYDSFSEQGLIEQLTFEGYTPEQAQYAVGQTY